MAILILRSSTPCLVNSKPMLKAVTLYLAVEDMATWVLSSPLLSMLWFHSNHMFPPLTPAFYKSCLALPSMNPSASVPNM